MSVVQSLFLGKCWAVHGTREEGTRSRGAPFDLPASALRPAAEPMRCPGSTAMEEPINGNSIGLVGASSGPGSSPAALPTRPDRRPGFGRRRVAAAPKLGRAAKNRPPPRRVTIPRAQL